MTIGAADLQDYLFGDDDLRAAVMLSLLLDRRAEDDDVLPAEDGDRRGWLGDEFAQVDGDRIGSRLWLLARSKRDEHLAERAELYAREALAWLVEDKVAASVEVSATTSSDRLYLTIAITRPTSDRVRFKFAHAWDSLGFEFVEAETF